MKKQTIKLLKTFLLLFVSILPSETTSKLLLPRIKPLIFATGSLAIKRSGGYEEGAFVEWKGPNSDTYSVYYKPVDGEYVQIDSMLIRKYSIYFRADALGLKPGSYILKIVANAGKDEIETDPLEVTAYDRSGFTFAKNSPATGTAGIGAYNWDGTLKKGATVLYVTEANKKTITMTIKGKTYTGISEITQQIKNKNSVGPVAIRLIGLLTLPDLSCHDMTSAYAIGVKEASQVTFEGVGEDATLQAGVAVFKSTSIEVRNLGFMLWGGGHDGDGIALKETKAAWVHNNDIFYGEAGRAADQVKGDGSMDLKDDSQYVTVSYNHFWDSGKMSLCGMKSESGENWISYHHNWFDHSDSRHPRIRTMSVHVYNNYYDGNAKYGVGMTYGGEAFVEKNYFRNCKYPMLISLQGTDKDAGGNFSSENGGIIKSFANFMTGHKSYKTYSPDNTVEFDAYEVTDRNDKVPSSVTCLRGGTGYSNFDTDPEIMYEYTPLDAKDVPDYVMENAGRHNGGDFQWTFTEEDDTDYDVNKELMDALLAYESEVTEIGSGNYVSDNGNNSGDSGNNSGGQTQIIEGTVSHNFSTDGLESSFFTIVGNLKSVNYSIGGMTFSECLKLESSTSITFTVSKESKLTLVTDNNTSNFKLDGVKTNTDASGITIVIIEAGEHVITKANTGFLYYITIE